MLFETHEVAAMAQMHSRTTDHQAVISQQEANKINGSSRQFHTKHNQQGMMPGGGRPSVPKRARKDELAAAEDDNEESPSTVPAAFQLPVRMRGEQVFELWNDDGTLSLSGLSLSAVAPCCITPAPDGGWFIGGMSVVVHATAFGVVTALAGDPEQDGAVDGVGAKATFDCPTSMVLSEDGTTLYVAGQGNEKIRTIDVDTGTVATLAGSGKAGSKDGKAGNAQFNSPTGLALSADGSSLFVADKGNHKIRKIDVATRAVTTLAGTGSTGCKDGVGSKATFNCPMCIVLSRDGTSLFVADRDNHKIRKVDVASGAVSTFSVAFSDPKAFHQPKGIQLSSDGCALFVADGGSNAIKKVDAFTGEISGFIEGHADPWRLALSHDGGTLMSLSDEDCTLIAIGIQMAPLDIPASSLSHDLRRMRGRHLSYSTGSILFYCRCM